MNMNDFAVLVARKEKGKAEISIAQVKEVIRIIRLFLLRRTGLDIYEIIRRIK
ncbi:MAG: hypothetical protein Q8O36_07020 [Candidatus Omnitrophota bacterium]|nr:hypothetical protein [Candidatus Omnitrophota bacterium]